MCDCGDMADELQATYVRLPKDLHQAVKDRSAEDERTMAQTIRLALRHYLQSTSPTLRS